MKCSDCGKTIKPVVAIDIDGTLADYHEHFLRFARQYLQHFPHYIPYDGSIPFREWFCKTFGARRETWDDIKLAYRQGGMKRSQPLLDGANDIYHSTIVAGAEVWVTTTRPFLRLDNIDPDTRFWLQRNGMGEYHGLLYDEHKYKRLAEIVEKDRVVAILDDLPEQYDSAEELFGMDVPILRRGTYNRSVNRRNVAHDAKSAVLAIRGRIQSWSRDQSHARSVA